jgi:hypothetical protein
MASTQELQAQLAYAQKLVRDAADQGLITAATRDEHLRALGHKEAKPVTITLQVEGESTMAPAGYEDEVNRRVEAALRGVAREAGLTVVAGSVNVQL